VGDSEIEKLRPTGMPRTLQCCSCPLIEAPRAKATIRNEPGKGCEIAQLSRTKHGTIPPQCERALEPGPNLLAPLRVTNVAQLHQRQRVAASANVAIGSELVEKERASGVGQRSATVESVSEPTSLSVANKVSG
jgi:hypothetical protein